MNFLRELLLMETPQHDLQDEVWEIFNSMEEKVRNHALQRFGLDSISDIHDMDEKQLERLKGRLMRLKK